MFLISDNCIFIDVDETLIINMTPNFKLIEKIKYWHEKGRTIIVWTSNAHGVKHAVNAVKYCEIENYITLILPKPRTIVDDDHLEYYSIIDPETLEWKKIDSKRIKCSME